MRVLPKVCVDMAVPKPLLSMPARFMIRGAGSIFAPVCAIIAASRGTPGMQVHRTVSNMALRWLVKNRVPSIRRHLLNLVSNPIVLTRYQEFDFAWRHVPAKIDTYLDVSSPIVLPLKVIEKQVHIRATLLNPDKSDLATTEQLIDAGGLRARCTTSDELIGSLAFKDSKFDLITCLSVLEHIPENKQAVQKMWQLLRPGGTLIITVPCSAHAYELHTSSDHYGLLITDKRGYAFLEYLYDDQLLQDYLFSVTGIPDSIEIYGELKPGFLRKELLRRWGGNYTRFWAEPLLMGSEFRRFEKLADLPGEGVICLSWVKHPATFDESTVPPK